MGRLVYIAVLCLLVTPADARKNKKKAPDGPAWHAIERALPGPAEVVGGYAGGCLIGAEVLPRRGVGFQSIRRWRKRFYGHPELLRFIQLFGHRVRVAGLPDMLIGDLSQPRGGRMKSGHRSHQSGLDADIWFERPPKSKRGKDLHFPSLVDRASETIDRGVFAPRHVAALEMAARTPEVARVFVNWVIKRELCATAKGDRDWLRKIRPWYGHDRHFHVRLHCPADSPDCRPQRPLPAHDGCGQESWFSRAAKAERKRAARAGKRIPRPARPAPPRTDIAAQEARCASVLAASPVPGPTRARAVASPRTP